MRVVVRERAQERGMNIDQLAKAAGLNYQTVLKLWHNRVSRLDISTLEAIAEALHIEPLDLLTNEGETVDRERAF